MNINNQAIQYILCFLRKLHLVDVPDYVMFFMKVAQTRASNKMFLKRNPEFVPPSLWGMYEAYAHCDYQVYFKMGADTAGFVVDIIEKYSKDGRLSILEWGCGPGRVIRHLPRLLGARVNRLTGIDYNSESIEYCRKNLKGIEFITNELGPPTGFDNSTFDVIYAISVFTHLSEDMHYAWVKEMKRILKPGGIFIATFHGKNYKLKLLPKELSTFESGKLVVREGAKEGSHMYSAYHPSEFLSNVLLKDFEFLETFDRLPGVMEQELRIVRNRS